MADCECLPKCPFFNDKMADMPAMASMYKKRYCEEDNSECGRYMIFSTLGKEHVPADLYPNDRVTAQAIIDTAS